MVFLCAGFCCGDGMKSRSLSLSGSLWSSIKNKLTSLEMEAVCVCVDVSCFGGGGGDGSND